MKKILVKPAIVFLTAAGLMLVASGCSKKSKSHPVPIPRKSGTIESRSDTKSSTERNREDRENAKSDKRHRNHDVDTGSSRDGGRRRTDRGQDRDDSERPERDSKRFHVSEKLNCLIDVWGENNFAVFRSLFFKPVVDKFLENYEECQADDTKCMIGNLERLAVKNYESSAGRSMDDRNMHNGCRSNDLGCRMSRIEKLNSLTYSEVKSGRMKRSRNCNVDDLECTAQSGIEFSAALIDNGMRSVDCE